MPRLLSWFRKRSPPAVTAGVPYSKLSRSVGHGRRVSPDVVSAQPSTSDFWRPLNSTRPQPKCVSCQPLLNMGPVIFTACKKCSSDSLTRHTLGSSQDSQNVVPRCAEQIHWVEHSAVYVGDCAVQNFAVAQSLCGYGLLLAKHAVLKLRSEALCNGHKEPSCCTGVCQTVIWHGSELHEAFVAGQNMLRTRNMLRTLTNSCKSVTRLQTYPNGTLLCCRHTCFILK